jgi:putative flippase GtrA
LNTARLQIIKFASIGVVNTLLHGSVLWIVVERLHWPVLVAHCLAFIVANVFSYIMNCQWTFKSHFSFKSYVKFLSASLVSLLLTLFISGVAQWQGFNYWFGFAMIVVLVPALNFLLIKFWAFNQNEKKVVQ